MGSLSHYQNLDSTLVARGVTLPERFRWGGCVVQMIAGHLEHALQFEQMALDATDAALKESLLKQAAAYRKLAEERAERLGIRQSQAVTAPAPGPNRATWRIGQRVARKDTKELGTVTETDDEIKVKWDSGKTSYYRHGAAANVELEPEQ